MTVTVNSVPQGASLRVDGKEAGTAPKSVEVAVGKHPRIQERGFHRRRVSAGDHAERRFRGLRQL
jgi:IS5 family transposase